MSNLTPEQKEELKNARKLLDITVGEVSLVGRPANLRTFLVVKDTDHGNHKGNNTMDKDLLELLNKFNGEEIPTEELEKAYQPEKVITVVKAAITMLSQYREELPADLVKAVLVLAKHASPGYGAEETVEQSEESREPLTLAKAGARISAANRTKLRALQAEFNATIGSMLPAETEEEAATKKKTAEEAARVEKQDALMTRLEKYAEKMGDGNEEETEKGNEEEADDSKLTKEQLLEKRLATLEAQGAEKSKLPDEKDDKKPDGKEFNWASFKTKD